MKKFQWSFAISYAEKDSKEVESIVLILMEKYGFGDDIFWAPNYVYKFWGTDKEKIYKKELLDSKLVLVFISKNYLEGEWTRFEWDVIQKRDKENKFLPIKLDDSEIIGLPRNVHCLDYREMSKEKIVELAVKKLEEFDAIHGLKSKSKEEKLLEKKNEIYNAIKNIENYSYDRAKVQTIIIPSKKSIYFNKILSQFMPRYKAKEKNIEALFGFLKDADFTTGDIPPDDIDSLRLFKSWFFKYFRNNREIVYYNSSLPADINKNLCSIGGPVDQLFTRYGMGYNRSGGKWKDILPYVFPIDETKELSTPILREWKGHSWKETNWYISDNDGNRVFTPTVDKKGVLNKDYFMLIIAPNTFTEQAYLTDKKHVIIAPSHGLAQLALKDILDDDMILEKISKAIKKTGYLQTIIEVPAKLTKKGYLPYRRFSICAMEPLYLEDFKKIGSYKDWLNK